MPPSFHFSCAVPYRVAIPPGRKQMSEFDKHLVIENPNSCKQGHCPNHAENPHHETLAEYGWEYSHTTPICRVDGSYTAHHTYRFPNTENTVSVICAPGWRTEASKLGSSRLYVYFGSQLRKYLKRKTRKLVR